MCPAIPWAVVTTTGRYAHRLLRQRRMDERSQGLGTGRETIGHTGYYNYSTRSHTKPHTHTHTKTQIPSHVYMLTMRVSKRPQPSLSRQPSLPPPPLSHLLYQTPSNRQTIIIIIHAFCPFHHRRDLRDRFLPHYPDVASYAINFFFSYHYDFLFFSCSPPFFLVIINI